MSELVSQALEVVRLQTWAILNHIVMSWWYRSLTHRLTHQEKVKPTQHNKQTLTSYLRDSFRILIKSCHHRRNFGIKWARFTSPTQETSIYVEKKPLIPQRTAPGINSFWLSHIVKTSFCTPYCSCLTKFFTNYPPIRSCEFDRQSRPLAKCTQLHVEHRCMGCRVDVFTRSSQMWKFVGWPRPSRAAQ